MVKKNRVSGQGFTLLEILLALGILGVLTVFGISLASSVRNAANVSDTERRMQEIAAKAKSFYRNSRTLPPGGGTPPGSDGTTPVPIPVAANQLNLEQKYRQDSWGTPMEYYQANVTLGPFTIPKIDGYIFNNKSCAAILLSFGPNGKRDSTITAGTPVIVTTGGDDIIIPIDVSQEAVEVALDDLKILQAKVKAFDALYEGIDNGGLTPNPDDYVAFPAPDDKGCAKAQPVGTITQCPPISLHSFTGSNDPNCGSPTLDYIESQNGAAYTCNTLLSIAPIPSPPGVSNEGSALDLILTFYSLPTSLTIDPWGRVYRWGCDSGYATCTYRFANTDIHYHKFYSAGPDVASATDDIIP